MEKDYNIWFGNRLNEIVDHKGLTAKALGELSGVGRMTISRILRGRYATAEEVKKIADVLGITVDRLKQKDVEISREKRNRQRVILNFDQELQEALHNISVAIGKTEIGLSYQVLGTYYYIIGDFRNAVDAYRKSFQILKDSDDSSLVFEAYNSLMIGLVFFRDYDSLHNMFQEAEFVFQSKEENYDRFLALKASIMAEYTKQYDQSFAIYKRLCDKYRENDDYKYRTALANMAEVCFRLQQYEQAEHYWGIWFRDHSKNETNRYIRLVICKDYAKALLCVGKTMQALQILEQNIEEVFDQNIHKLTSKYLFLIEVIRGDGSAAKQILGLDIENEQLKLLCTMLLARAYEREDKHLEALHVFRTILSNNLILE